MIIFLPLTVICTRSKNNLLFYGMVPDSIPELPNSLGPRVFLLLLLQKLDLSHIPPKDSLTHQNECHERSEASFDDFQPLYLKLKITIHDTALHCSDTKYSIPNWRDILLSRCKTSSDTASASPAKFLWRRWMNQLRLFFFLLASFFSRRVWQPDLRSAVVGRFLSPSTTSRLEILCCSILLFLISCYLLSLIFSFKDVLSTFVGPRGRAEQGKTAQEVEHLRLWRSFQVFLKDFFCMNGTL